MLSVAEARQRLLEHFSPLETEHISLVAACGRVLAENIVSNVDLPFFTNSSMDGFAVRSDDVFDAKLEHPASLLVVADLPAGYVSPVHLYKGEAIRIMTGAPLPEGADAVVPIEYTDQDHRGVHHDIAIPSTVKIYRPVSQGEFVRPKGQDIQKGMLVIKSGTRIRPQEVGLLAILGIAEVAVHRSPKVVLISTGDELVPINQPLKPGKIHDSNAYTLASLVEKNGGIPINLGITPDQESAVKGILDDAVRAEADLIVSSAGVSVGAFDFVRKVVEKYGKLHFWQVNMRPGKPLVFGSYKGVPFIGLPGNPVSAFIGYKVFVGPTLHKMNGQPDSPHPTMRVNLLEPIESDGREGYLRAVVNVRDGNWYARLTGHQGSGNLLSLVQANSLLIVPSGVKSLPVGAEVEVWLLNDDIESL